MLNRCAPTALSTMRPQKVRSACASAKEYPEPAVMRAVLSTLSLGLDARREARLPVVLLQPGEQSGAGEQVEIARQGGRVPGVLELPHHLGIRQDLPRAVGAQLEEPLQQGRLVYPGHGEDISFDVGLHEAAEDIVAPLIRLPDEGCCPRPSSEVEVLRQVEVEGRGHLREGPVSDADGLEAAGEALAQSRLHEQRRGTQDDHSQGAVAEAVGVPQPLHCLRPPLDLLDLVEDQHGPAGRPFRFEPGLFPLAHQPFRVPLRVQPEGGRSLIVRGGEARGLGLGLVDREVAVFQVSPRQGLEHNGGLAGLTRPEEGDDMANRLAQALDERVDLWALEGLHARGNYAIE